MFKKGAAPALNNVTQLVDWHPGHNQLWQQIVASLRGEPSQILGDAPPS
jgi:hypothetical protein